jgi:hypothetical protein
MRIRGPSIVDPCRSLLNPMLGCGAAKRAERLVKNKRNTSAAVVQRTVTRPFTIG